MNRRLYKVVLLVVAAGLLAASGAFQKRLNRLRADPALALTRAAPLDPEQAPPMLAFTTVALGSFRGLIANALWLRANDLQQEGRFFEMVQLADWITKLEPTFTQVWLVQAWNMAYNISVKFTDPADRWQWVLRGIELLRDEGIRYCPREPMVYRELAWFFQHKMGQIMDDAHFYYKTQWARTMTNAFGGDRPNYAELLNPQTDAARSHLAVLRDRLKMDPRRMQELERTYGSLEWRLPEAHAIYWASLGLEKTAGKEHTLFLRRAVYQSLQLAAYRGRVVRMPADGLIETGPDFSKIKLANDGYEKMIAEEQEKKDVVQRPHRNFLREVVYLLYTHHRLVEADYWFRYVREKYPEAIPPNVTLEQYSLERLVGSFSSLGMDKTKTVVEGLLFQFYRSLGVGDDDRANGLLAMAKQVWQYYAEQTKQSRERIGLPPFEQMQQNALDAILRGETPLSSELIEQLRARLRLPATPPGTTNAPAPAPAPAAPSATASPPRA